jgi:hypothetical protein
VQSIGTLAEVKKVKNGKEIEAINTIRNEGVDEGVGTLAHTAF